MIGKTFKAICECGKSEGLIVFGATRVQCPVWVLHLKMFSKDNDPFFAIDKAILKYIKMQPICDTAYLSAIIGMDIDFVQWRKDELSKNEMIRVNAITHGYEITSLGERKYLLGNGERPDVEIFADLPIDGISLELLDIEFYNSRAYYSDRRSDSIVAEPIISSNDEKIRKALRKIERMTSGDKVKYHLERESHSYSIEGFDLKTIDNVYIALCYDTTDNKCVRKIYFNNKFISSIDSLKNSIDNYYLSFIKGVCVSSDGYIPKDGNPFVNFREEEICNIIKERYQMDSVTPDDFLYIPAGTPSVGTPLTIKVTEDFLERANLAERVMNDALNTNFNLDIKESILSKWKTGFFIVNVANNIPERVERYALIKKYKKEHGKLDSEFLNDLYPDVLSWRSELIKLGLYSDLEEVDIQQYIKYAK